MIGTGRRFPIKICRFSRFAIDSLLVVTNTEHANQTIYEKFAMSKNVSDELRQALDNPTSRYRIVDAWVLLQKKETLEAKKVARETIDKERRGHKD